VPEGRIRTRVLGLRSGPQVRQGATPGEGVPQFGELVPVIDYGGRAVDRDP